jgi:hypothetical protein
MATDNQLWRKIAADLGISASERTTTNNLLRAIASRLSIPNPSTSSEGLLKQIAISLGVSTPRQDFNGLLRQIATQNTGETAVTDNQILTKLLGVFMPAAKTYISQLTKPNTINDYTDIGYFEPFAPYSSPSQTVQINSFQFKIRLVPATINQANNYGPNLAEFEIFGSYFQFSSGVWYSLKPTNHISQPGSTWDAYDLLVRLTLDANFAIEKFSIRLRSLATGRGVAYTCVVEDYSQGGMRWVPMTGGASDASVYQLATLEEKIYISPLSSATADYNNNSSKFNGVQRFARKQIFFNSTVPNVATLGNALIFDSSKPTGRDTALAPSLANGDFLNLTSDSTSWGFRGANSRWLNTAIQYQSFSFGALSASSGKLPFAIDRSLYDLYVRKIYASFNTVGTLTGANYWAATFWNAASAVQTLNATAGDNAEVTGDVYKSSSAIDSSLVMSNSYYPLVSLVKNAAAPDLTGAAVMIEYQLALK